MRTVAEVLAHLNSLDIKLWAKEERLQYSAPQGAMTPEVLAEIALYKIEILRFLRKEEPLPQVIIAPESRHQPFLLTDIQQAYWLGRLQAFDLGNIASHLYLEIENSALDLPRLAQAWQKTLCRHEMLRMVVLPDGQQQILPEVPVYEIAVSNLRECDAAAIDSEIARMRTEMSHQVRPTEKWPLFEIRATLLPEEKDKILLPTPDSRLQAPSYKVRLHISLDALICDAASLNIIFSDWYQFYTNPELELETLELSFRDYVIAAAAINNTELYQRSQQYWFDRLDTLPPAPELPLAKHPSAIAKPQFVRLSATLTPALWQQLKQRAKQAGITDSGVLLAAYAEVLTSWSRNPRFTINLTLFNRLPLHPQVNQIVGDFTSLTLLEVDNSTPAPFINRAIRLQKQLWQDLEHRYISGVKVQQKIARHRGSANAAVMPVVFTSTLGLSSVSSNINNSKLGDVVYNISQTPQVWIDHQVVEQDGGLTFNWDALAEIFPDGVLQDMFDAYCQLLEKLATSSAAWNELQHNLIPSEQLAQRAKINDNRAPISSETLASLYLAQVEPRASELAIISEEKTLTYSELFTVTQNLAARLRKLGATPNTLVAVVMEKGWEQVVAVLAILISGAAYLPIDPDLPQERLNYLLEVGQVSLVVTQSHLELSVPEDINRLCVESEDWHPLQERQLVINQPEDLAYVIFTSGSTGVPKGVAIDHRGAVNTILDINQRFNVNASDRVLAISALNFDLSVYDIFGILAAGGAIVMPPTAGLKDPEIWQSLMAKYQVTLWNTVPALMQMLVEYSLSSLFSSSASSLRLALLSGDWIPLHLPEQIKTLWPNLKLVSLGGATEASIWSIGYEIDSIDQNWKSIPYGKPLLNQTFHVLNHSLQPCPVWVLGQLYIGGLGLAKEYWQDPEKTANSFIIHPVTQERLYKTGDLGRYLPDGNIEFAGREDFQVKINGYRIELGEIEAALLQHEAVKTAVVTATERQPGQRALIAYVVLNPNLQQSSQQLSETFAHPQLAGILLDPLERAEFKLAQRGLRTLEPEQTSIELPKGDVDKNLIHLFTKRQSYRKFQDRPIPIHQFGGFLSALMQMKQDSFPLPKYRYPSAGSLYPVQVYLAIKPDRAEKIAGGIYYYHPEKHSLVLLNTAVEIPSSVHVVANQPQFEQSAFSLFLIGQLNAITPIYGELAKDFCLLEAGYIGQLLMEAASENQMGLCPIGYLEFKDIKNLFSLESTHVLLHSFVGGAIDPDLSDHQTPPKPERISNSVAEELLKHVAKKLPSYMIPSDCIILDALPLNSNGKVDRQSLPIPDLVRSASPTVPAVAQTERERRITDIWQQILGLEQVGIYDNFFEVGGDSLRIVQLQRKLNEVFGRNISVAELFQYPTIHSLSIHLSQSSIVEGETQQREETRSSGKAAMKQQRQLRQQHRLGNHS